MFAQKGEYESEARLDCGPPTPGAGDVPSLDLLLKNGITHHSMDACAENAVSVLPNDDDDAEPDSSANYMNENVIVHCRKQTELAPIGSRALEHDLGTPNQPQEMVVESDDVHTQPTGEGALQSNPTLVLQSGPKLASEFTLDIHSGVGNLASIQNVSAGNQKVWLPTLLTSGSTADNQLYEDEMEVTPSTVSQIILTGSQHFPTHTVSNQLVSGSKVVANHKYSPKVQILSSITIPKQNSISNLTQVNASNIKGVIHANYLSDLSKINSPVTSLASKQVVNNSILNNQIGNKGTTGLPLGIGRVQPGQALGSSASPTTVQLNSHRSVNKLGNVTSTKMITSTIAMPNQQSHVLSRVVPGPKMSLQASGRGLKTTNSLQYNQKTPGKAGLFPNVVHRQKVTSAMPVKIIQQQNLSVQKTGMKTLPPSRQAVSSSKHVTYNSSNPSLPVKSWSTIQSQTSSQKEGSYSKSASGVVSLQKVTSKNAPQKLVLQSSPNQGPIIMASSPQSPQSRVHTQYYQPSPEPDNTVRYIRNYMKTETQAANYSSNQNLTAQILQSLSQPKILYPIAAQAPTSTVHTKPMAVSHHSVEEESYQYFKCTEQMRQIHGDPTTLLIADDIVGVEERPPPSDESLPYQYHTLQLIMLDHTYAVTTQAVASASNSTTPPTSNPMSLISQTILTTSPVMPSKVVPVTSQHAAAPQMNGLSAGQITATSGVSVNSTVVQSSMGYQYKMTPVEDDAASIISSIEGDTTQRAMDRHDSDTETAPEGEEEGKTRCVCEFTHDDGYMICCDRCGEWQHVDCMGIDRQNIPDDYMCDRCQPRLMDRKRARSIQMRKREELTGLGTSGSDSSTTGSALRNRNKRPAVGAPLTSHKKRPLTVTTYSNTVGGVSRAVPMVSTQHPNYNLVSTVPTPSVKRVPKRPRRVDNGRKGPKRKIPEKKMKRKSSDLAGYRNKFCAVPASSQQLTQWNESYESAMTNHYSPELRAKVARYYNTKVGGNTSAMAVVLTAHHCTTVPHAGGKILIATKDMKENAPIIELRGKYMLSTQHRPQPQLPGRAGSQRPGPFLFFYRLPRDSTQVCIDTRTYGNEARFVRRSCKPNAELQHCIIKGALHVYLVTISSVQSNTEISIKHETTGSWHPCACGNPKHCKQNTVSSTMLHRTNGAPSDSAVRERRGRTRHSSSSSLFSPVSLNSPPVLSKNTPSPKHLLSPKVERRRRSEPEFVQELVTPELIEPEPPIKKEIFEPLSIAISPEKEPLKMEIIPKKEEVEIPKTEVIECVKEEFETKSLVNEELPVEPELPILQVKEEKPDVLEKTIENELVKPNELKCPVQATEQVSDVDSPKKDSEKPSKNLNLPRRTSVHSTRTTRASLSAVFTASESADEKSDTPCDGNTKPLSAKDKKKMNCNSQHRQANLLGQSIPTREERKMEAIMKAFERMEKAELRKQENRDRQTKRRESDPQQPTSATNETKELNCEEEQYVQNNLKQRRRRKGRSRTTSQSNQITRNRLNSMDSDMVTSGEESTSLLSPPLRAGSTLPEHFSDLAPLVPEDSTSYQEQTLSEQEAVLEQSIERINVGLSSACLLVEAAVGPLETTFKFPKTKKAIMNEWLNKSPETNLTYEVAHPLDFMPTDNNNSTHPYAKQSFLGGKSLESLVRAADTMIGNLSGGIPGFTPEKEYPCEQAEPENLSAMGLSDSPDSPANVSPISYLPRGRKGLRDSCREAINFSNDKIRTPKKFRKGLRSCIEERQSPIKRSLRSSIGYNSRLDPEEATYGNCTPPQEEEQFVNTVIGTNCPRDADVSTIPQPPQHSAKKRWLRQAISEESDSPTAESPPNEMVTPLKKRRLARESLSVEPTSFGHCDDAQYSTLLGTPRKDTTPVQTYNSLAFPTRDEKKTELFLSEALNIEHRDIKDSEDVSESIDTDQSSLLMIENMDSTTKTDDGKNKDTLCSDKFESTELKSLCNELKKDLNSRSDNIEVLGDFSSFKSVKKMGKHSLISKDDTCLEESEHKASCSLAIEPRSEPASIVHSTETSGNSSPLLDEMDDIKKKIHSFHTENIQILKIRNKKQPKEKRKKVNLNFDLCVLADQTIGVELKQEEELSKSDAKDSQKSIDFNSNPATPDSNSIADPEQPENVPGSPASIIAPPSPRDGEGGGVNTLEVSATSEASTSLNLPSNIFSDTLKKETSTETPSIAAPNLSVIKNAIDMTTNLDTGVFSDKSILNSVDEYRNVQEILIRVNQMDSRNSVLLSGVLRDSNHSVSPDTTTPTKVFHPRSNDPRLNPPPVEKPKPIRRKLSITEYRRRHSMVTGIEGAGSGAASPPRRDSASPSPSPPLPEDLAARLDSVIAMDSLAGTKTKGVFNAQPTLLEKQRENLSERLRREFGLLLPEDEEAQSGALSDVVGVAGLEPVVEASAAVLEFPPGTVSLGLEPPPLRLHR